MKMYKPNFNDPRIIKKASSAWRLTSINLHATKPRQWSTRHIDTWVGHNSKLSKWLRSQLLICVDPYYNPEQGKSKKYILNEANWIDLGMRLELFKKLPCATQVKAARIQAADAVFGQQIATGNFAYTQKNNRLWNPIQRLDNATRKPLFANYGYVHEYDIRSAAPTIIAQYARNLTTKPTTTVDAYIEDPTHYRNQLAQDLEVDVKTAKTLITQRFAGANFGPQNSIANTLDGRWVAYNKLKNHTWYGSLSEDITHIWTSIKPHAGITQRFTSRLKWNIYFQEELKVMQSVHSYLRENNIQYFHEHDGWRSPKPVDLNQLKQHLQIDTGYTLDFSYLEYIPLLEVFDVL